MIAAITPRYSVVMDKPPTLLCSCFRGFGCRQNVYCVAPSFLGAAEDLEQVE